MFTVYGPWRDNASSCTGCHRQPRSLEARVTLIFHPPSPPRGLISPPYSSAVVSSTAGRRRVWWLRSVCATPTARRVGSRRPALFLPEHDPGPSTMQVVTDGYRGNWRIAREINNGDLPPPPRRAGCYVSISSVGAGDCPIRRPPARSHRLAAPQAGMPTRRVTGNTTMTKKMANPASA